MKKIVLQVPLSVFKTIVTRLHLYIKNDSTELWRTYMVSPEIAQVAIEASDCFVDVSYQAETELTTLITLSSRKKGYPFFAVGEDPYDKTNCEVKVEMVLDSIQWCLEQMPEALKVNTTRKRFTVPKRI